MTYSGLVLAYSGHVMAYVGHLVYSGHPPACCGPPLAQIVSLLVYSHLLASHVIGGFS